jgi:Na+/phosphate symporter
VSEPPPAPTAPGPGRRLLARLRQVSARVVWVVVSLGLFAVALILVKTGARPVAPLLQGTFRVNSPLTALGFGWLFSSLVLSGSPVAAASLSFLDAGVLTPDEAFAMIAGSRLGAAFIVLLVGFVYILRGRSREGALSVGLLSLLVTQTVYLPAVMLGYLAIQKGWFLSHAIRSQAETNSPIDRLLQPALVSLSAHLPAWVFFPTGFLLMMASFSLIDRALPKLHLEQTSLGRLSRVLYRPMVTFLLGAGITALTMSVSLSLSLLVPLSARGYIRQENAIPYIMGANITTFDDTLVAAALLANPSAVAIVVAQMVSVALVSLLILVFAFRRYERALVRLARRIGSGRASLALYLCLTFAVPLALLIFG